LKAEKERKIKADQTRISQMEEVKKSQENEKANLNEMHERKSENSQEQYKKDQS